MSDEKHSRLNGENVYIAITIAEDCVLGTSVSLTADTEGLIEAYGHFQREARHLDPDYQPETVNIDGWAATQKAWLALFPSITIIECFLHAFLEIRNRCKKRFEEIYHEIAQRVWDIYRADNAAAFRVQIEALQQWASQALHGHVLEAVEKLCAKADRFLNIHKLIAPVI